MIKIRFVNCSTYYFYGNRKVFLYRIFLNKLSKGEEICYLCFSISLKKDSVKLSEAQKSVKRLEKTKTNSCLKCDATFPRQTSLAHHIKSEHSDLFRCAWDECNKHFGSQSQLDTHMKRHLKEFSHFCNVCNKGFVNIKELNMHTVFHKPTKEALKYGIFFKYIFLFSELS